MGRDVERATAADELLGFEGFVGAHRLALCARQRRQHVQSRLALGLAVGLGEPRVDRQCASGCPSGRDP